MSDEPTTSPAHPPRPPAPVGVAPARNDGPPRPAPGVPPQFPRVDTVQPGSPAGRPAGPLAAPSSVPPARNAPSSWSAPAAWPTGPQPAAPPSPAASPFTAPYAAGPRGSFPEPAARRSSAAGVVALVAAVLAAVGASTAGAIASFAVGTGTDAADFEATPTWNGLGFLSPVREWVLLGEVSFWIGTGLGIWAIIQGVVAIATGRGRTAAIVAVVVAVLGPVIFFAAAAIGLALGLDAGPALGGGS